MLPIKLIKSLFKILPAFPVPPILDISIFFSSTIFLTEGDKCCLVLGGIYFSFFISLESSSTSVSRIKASLKFSSFF